MGDAVTTTTRLAECESQITDALERGRIALQDLGQALRRVRVDELYRVTHTTFEAYCRERWGIRKSQVYRLIAGADVVALLSPMGDEVDRVDTLPTNERQVRPLTRLPREEQAEAWQEAARTAPNGRVTGAHVQEVVRRRTEPEPEVDPGSGETLEETMGDPVEALTHEIQRLEKENAHLRELNESLSQSDRGSVVTAWSDKYGRLKARLDQALTTSAEATRQAKYQAELLARIRRTLDVQRNSEILGVLAELAP